MKSLTTATAFGLGLLLSGCADLPPTQTETGEVSPLRCREAMNSLTMTVLEGTGEVDLVEHNGAAISLDNHVQAGDVFVYEHCDSRDNQYVFEVTPDYAGEDAFVLQFGPKEFTDFIVSPDDSESFSASRAIAIAFSDGITEDLNLETRYWRF